MLADRRARRGRSHRYIFTEMMMRHGTCSKARYAFVWVRVLLKQELGRRCLCLGGRPIHIGTLDQARSDIF